MAETNFSEAARAAELFAKSEYAPSAGKFLTPAEQAEFHRAVKELGSDALEKLYFWGGCKGTERRMPVFLPEYMCSESGITDGFIHDSFLPEREELFLSLTNGWDRCEMCSYDPVRIRGGGFISFSHRDYLGSILALGIERDTTGDIISECDFSALVFLSRPIGAFAEESLTRVGRDRVDVRRTSLPEDFTVIRKFEEIVLISASTRLDGIVRAFTALSREESQRLINSGMVEVNYLPETRVDFRLNPEEKSIVSVRGYGKIKITGVIGETRSGRMRITAEKYI